jgi:hypothetical protein
VGTLLLDDTSGLRVSSLELGLPDVRAVAASRVGQSGTTDTTEHHGASLVTAEMTVFPVDGRTKQQTVDQLRAFCRPGLRPWLYFRLEPDGEERRIRLRADQWSAPLTSPAFQRVRVSWRAPDGVQEAITETTAAVSATADSEGGLSFPVVLPVQFAAEPSAGVIVVNNEGTTAAVPVIRIYGPCTGPRIENQTVGRALEFDADFTVGAGSYVEIDVLERTVRLNGLAAQSRYDRLDFPASQWWSLEPGDNQIRFYPVAWSGGSKVNVLYRSAWL